MIITVKINKLKLVFAQKNKNMLDEGTCFCCGKKGHWSTKCPKKDKPKSQWAIYKSMTHMQQQSHSSNANNQEWSGLQCHGITTNDNKVIEWSGLQCNEILHNNNNTSSDMKENILLDNGSTLDLFSNKEFVSHIKTAEKPMELHTNTGSRITDKKHM